MIGLALIHKELLLRGPYQLDDAICICCRRGVKRGVHGCKKMKGQGKYCAHGWCENFTIFQGSWIDDVSENLMLDMYEWRESFTKDWSPCTNSLGCCPVRDKVYHQFSSDHIKLCNQCAWEITNAPQHHKYRKGQIRDYFQYTGPSVTEIIFFGKYRFSLDINFKSR
jgi:hypothetical protein